MTAASTRPAKFRAMLLAIVVLAIAYAAVDLWWPVQRDFRRFDPDAVGTLETKMWRSYYDRRPLALFLQLGETLRTQYGFPPLRSYLGAYYAASAAFEFKDGRNRAEYERALPALERYFAIVHRTGDIPFDVQQAARTELEWWIVHRQRAQYPPEALGRACAEAAAILYAVPVQQTLAHGQLRAQAMLLRDAAEERGKATEDDWQRIELLLHRSYQSLAAAARKQG